MFPPNRSIQCDGLGVRQHRAAEFLPPKRYRRTSMTLLPQNPLSHKAKGEWLLAPAVDESQVARGGSPSNGWRERGAAGPSGPDGSLQAARDEARDPGRTGRTWTSSDRQRQPGSDAPVIKPRPSSRSQRVCVLAPTPRRPATVRMLCPWSSDPPDHVLPHLLRAEPDRRDPRERPPFGDPGGGLR